MEDDFKIAVQYFEEFCGNNAVKPTNMKADYYISGFLRGLRHEQEQVRPLAWIYTNNKMPEQEVKVKAVYDGNLLALTEDVLCFYDNRRIIDRRRLFKQYGNKENVWVWHELEGCNVEYWMPLPELPIK